MVPARHAARRVAALPEVLPSRLHPWDHDDRALIREFEQRLGLAGAAEESRNIREIAIFRHPAQTFPSLPCGARLARSPEQVPVTKPFGQRQTKKNSLKPRSECAYFQPPRTREQIRSCGCSAVRRLAHRTTDQPPDGPSPLLARKRPLVRTGGSPTTRWE